MDIKYICVYKVNKIKLYYFIKLTHNHKLCNNTLETKINIQPEGLSLFIIDN